MTTHDQLWRDHEAMNRLRELGRPWFWDWTNVSLEFGIPARGSCFDDPADAILKPDTLRDPREEDVYDDID